MTQPLLTFWQLPRCVAVRSGVPTLPTAVAAVLLSFAAVYWLLALVCTLPAGQIGFGGCRALIPWSVAAKSSTFIQTSSERISKPGNQSDLTLRDFAAAALFKSARASGQVAR